MKKTIILSLLLICSIATRAQDWIEKSDSVPQLDLRGFKVMVILGQEFDFYEAIYIPNLWAKWGATVYYAGSENKLNGFLMQKQGDEFVIGQERELTTDILVREAFPDGYHLIYIPGGESPFHLLEDERMRKMVLKIIRDGHKQDKLLAGFSQGVHVLAEAGVLLERYFVSTSDVKENSLEKGGIYQEAKSVGHKNIMTGKWPYFDIFAIECAKYLERLKSKPKK